MKNRRKKIPELEKMLLKNNQYLTLFGQIMSNSQESIGLHFLFFYNPYNVIWILTGRVISCKSMSIHGATFADWIILPVDRNRTLVQRLHRRERR